MIKTKDLLRFMRKIRIIDIPSQDHQGQEYCHEIIVRLMAYDKLKKGIEKTIARLSNRIDKEK